MGHTTDGRRREGGVVCPRIPFHSMVAPHPKTKKRRPAAGGPRALWKGAISFGLVVIPVALRLAVKREELKFRLLRRGDLSPVNYKRVASVDGKEVAWADIVKGYEYEKGRYVVLKDEDFKRVDLEATDTIDIMDFVALDEISPLHFLRPYFLQPLRGGMKAYALLRAVLQQTGRVGIAKVVIKTRQHLAAVKVSGAALVLELMHFADELVDPAGLDLPPMRASGQRELGMAKVLVDQMTTKWDPARYTDDYASALQKMIRQKMAGGGGRAAAARPRMRGGADEDLVAILKESLERATRGEAPVKPRRRRARKT